MSGGTNPTLGRITWVDLTVTQADAVRDFYTAVVGWTPADVDMGEYVDFNMLGTDGTPAAGICHARDSNTGLPPTWLIYITVDDLDARLETCRTLGGDVLAEPRSLGAMGRFAVVRDPAGAAAALYEPAPPE
jgi:predicted enzyme related to lactoylglutathione lyase